MNMTTVILCVSQGQSVSGQTTWKKCHQVNPGFLNAQILAMADFGHVVKFLYTPTWLKWIKVVTYVYRWYDQQNVTHAIMAKFSLTLLCFLKSLWSTFNYTGLHEKKKNMQSHKSAHQSTILDYTIALQLHCVRPCRQPYLQYSDSWHKLAVACSSWNHGVSHRIQKTLPSEEPLEQYIYQQPRGYTSSSMRCL